MTQEHPITLSEDQIMLWCKQWNCIQEPGPIHKWLAIQAARWGADQELEACCEWLSDGWGLPAASDNLCAARRPKPPSLKERALSELDALENIGTCNSETIRCALEALPE